MGDTVHYHFNIDFSPLDSADDEELKRFLGKFKNIRRVTVDNGMRNEECLLAFLRALVIHCNPVDDMDRRPKRFSLSRLNTILSGMVNGGLENEVRFLLRLFLNKSGKPPGSIDSN